MSIETQCMTEKLIVITIKLDYSKVPSKSTVPTSGYRHPMHFCSQARIAPSISAFTLLSKTATTIIAAACRFLARSISNILTLNTLSV